MQIEILSRNVELKNRFLTRYARHPELWATGNKISIPGLEMEISDQYLLFNISSADLMVEILPLLFSVTPASSAGQLYEPTADLKMIVTARSKEPAELLPHLHEVSHLDLERGELLGVRLTEWCSRNVAVVARAEVAVQGSILLAKIKFSTHSRDSRYNCQACVDQISLRDIMKPLSPDFMESPPQPRVYGPLLRANWKTSGENWAEFLNHRPAPATYCHDTNQFKIDFSNAGAISFLQEPDRREILCQVEITNPAIINNGLLDMLGRQLGLEQVVITHRAENILLPPNYLMREMGFDKEAAFYLFSMSAEFFKAVYDIKKLELVLERSISIRRCGAEQRLLDEIFTGMRRFMGQVMSGAGNDN